MSRTQQILSLGERVITLIGTAHVSAESVAEVSAAVATMHPECVCVELDERRRESILNEASWRTLDIVKVLRQGEAFLMIGNVVLASFQRRMGQGVGVRPGDELVAALRAAEALAIPTVLVDRPIQVTLRRAWAQNSFWGKMKLLSLLFASVFETEEIPSAYIENLKTSNEMDIMMHELAEYLPAVKTVLVDERDRFLACRIWEAPGKNVLAVLGAGHLPGVRVHLENIANGKETTDTDSLCEVPEKRGIGRLFVYLIPLLIVALIVLGFVFGGRRTGGKMVVSWVLWNGALAAVGTLAALGHPLAVVAAAVTAPITSLTPVVGVGMVTGIVQAFFHKPKVNDLECLQTDAGSFRGWYRNRILRVLLVFLFSSLGSTVGTFLGGAGIIAAVSTFFSDFAAWVAHLFA